MTGEIYYLSSLDSLLFEPVRECRVVRALAFDSGKRAIEVHLTPSVIGQAFDRAPDIDTVVLTCRHEGAKIDPVREFPCFVFIAIPKHDGSVLHSPIRSDDLDVIAWGELYRTRNDAERHYFDGRADER